MMRTTAGSAFIASLLALGVGCAPLSAAPDKDAMAPLSGRWAGDGAALAVTPHGTRITLDCADGSIDGALIADDHGHFRATGRFDVHRPGPQLADEAAPGAAAQFTGDLDGDRLELTISDASGAKRTLHLVRNAPFKQMRCL